MGLSGEVECCGRRVLFYATIICALGATHRHVVVRMVDKSNTSAAEVLALLLIGAFSEVHFVSNLLWMNAPGMLL